MDFDPRDYDSRDDERYGADRERGSRGGSDDERDWDDWRQPAIAARDRDDDTRDLGRGPGDDSRRADSDKHGRDSRDDARWPERDRDGREREFDPRDVFTRDLHLPRDLEREIVLHRDREYTLRGSESRTLATVGAFRVVSSRDLRDAHDRELDPRSSDLRHLREQGLVDVVRIPGSREHAVVLTKEGRGVLETHRDRDLDGRQTFYNGLKRERELEHDVQVYRAYEREAERLHERGAQIERVILDYELRSEYQRRSRPTAIGASEAGPRISAMVRACWPIGPSTTMSPMRCNTFSGGGTKYRRGVRVDSRRLTSSVNWACCIWNRGLCSRLCESDVKPVGEPDAGKLHVRFDERASETERRDGLRHRRSGESRRSQLLPVSKVTAPILDSTLSRPDADGCGLEADGAATLFSSDTTIENRRTSRGLALDIPLFASRALGLLAVSAWRAPRA